MLACKVFYSDDVIPLCCGLVLLCAKVVGTNVDGLHSFEEFIYMFCEFVDSAEVIGCS